MYIVIEENPNCTGEERVFATNGPVRRVVGVQIELKGRGPQWCDITGIDEEGQTIEATAQQVEDSSDGIAWLIKGGAWGLRFRVGGNNEAWDLKNPNQWGAPFLVLDSGGKEIHFKD